MQTSGKLMRRLISIIPGQLVPFRPVYLYGDQFVISKNPVSDELIKNMKLVFQFYDVPYQEGENGVILISKKLWKDKDTIWNYTTKANDANWLHTHKTEERQRK